MCGRYTLILLDKLTSRFGADSLPDGLLPSYNVTPGAEHPVVTRDQQSGARRIELMRWGLVPSWAKEADQVSINVRSETVAEKPSFRAPFRRKRVLIPADGFYEGQKQGKASQPWYFRMKGAQPFAFAGIYDEYRYSGGVVKRGYAIITTEPNPLVAQAHDRMPVILRREDEEAWLTVPERKAAELLPLLSPYGAGDMEGWLVGDKIGSPAASGGELIEGS
jgi:putative SOS response-associated peptidase YedK